MILSLASLMACQEKYTSPVHVPAAGYLVVEGFIANDTGITQIKLSRSTSLDSSYFIAETGAQITVESKNGNSSIFLAEAPGGNYSGYANASNVSDQYRLHIITSNGKQYFSDYSAPQETPPIDSVNWKPTAGGLTIYVSTHDPADKIINYRWDYDETWEYMSAYGSGLIYRGTTQTLDVRQDSEQVHVCYLSASSTNISVGSASKFSQAEISEFPLTTVSYSSTNRLIFLYSINVKQYALSTAGYNYFELLKKNTEQLGSIFDAQPSEITGNIHCSTDTSEIVIGFIECTSKKELRIFISRSEIPPTPVYSGYEGCEVDTFAYNPATIDSVFSHYFYLPIDLLYNGGMPYAETASGYDCVDCREKGGVLTKPPYWPQ